MARPSKFTQKIADRICDEIAKGFSLRKICEADDLPTRETVRVWLNDKPEFSAQYTRAREEQSDWYADEIVEIADTEEDTQKARVRIDARKWVASKLKPKKWGDKVQQEISGPDGRPIETSIQMTFVDADTKGE